MSLVVVAGSAHPGQELQITVGMRTKKLIGLLLLCLHDEACCMKSTSPERSSKGKSGLVGGMMPRMRNVVGLFLPGIDTKTPNICKSFL